MLDDISERTTGYLENMKKSSLVFFLKNCMLMGSLAANMIGFLILELIGNYSVAPSSESVETVIKQVDFIYFPVAYAFMIIVTIIYEHPIRYFINQQHKKKDIPLTKQRKSCQRLLNEPFCLIALNLLIWIVASIVYPALLLNNQITGNVVGRIFFQTFLVGIIITTATFFILEILLKKYLVPYFFPDGGLYKTPGTLHITIRTRLIVLFTAINIIPLTALFLMNSGAFRSEYNKEQLLELLMPAVRFNTLIFILIGIVLVFLVNNSLTKPFEDIINVLKLIKKGNFEHKIKVSSRLQKLNKKFNTDLIISQTTHDLAEPDTIAGAEFIELPAEKVKGITEPVQIFAVKTL
jgi:adenylate cyclase